LIGTDSTDDKRHVGWRPWPGICDALAAGRHDFHTD
jgi:hypothetical protein